MSQIEPLRDGDLSTLRKHRDYYDPSEPSHKLYTRILAHLESARTADSQINVMSQHIDKLKAELEQTRWVSVDERLPEISDGASPLVLVRTYALRTKISYVEADGEWSTGEQVTHWMPLPTPPPKARRMMVTNEALERVGTHIKRSTRNLSDPSVRRYWQEILTALEKLPVTADGMRVVPGCDLYLFRHGRIYTLSECCWVGSRLYHADGFLVSFDWSECYSTREAAEQAAKKTD